MIGKCPPLSRTLKHLLPPDTTAASRCEPLLYRCATTKKSFATTQKLHARAIASGILSNHFLSLLAAAYALSGHSSPARRLFYESPEPTLVAYKAMIRMHVENANPRDALELFVEMRGSTRHAPDEYTYPFVIRACGQLVLLNLGEMIHGSIFRSGVLSGGFVGNSLLAMYMNCGCTDGAKMVFSEMQGKTVVSWNTMISGYFRNGHTKEALLVFRTMVDNQIELDSATVLSVLPACGYLKDVDMGDEVYEMIKNKSVVERLEVQNALIDMYIKGGRIDKACVMFDEMGSKDVITWTTLVHGYALSGDTRRAVELCRLMQFDGIRPSEVTLASLLAMCADSHEMMLGKCLHGWAIRQHLDCDVNVETALIDLYAKSGSFGLSFRVFSRTSKKNTVPWNAILSSCIHNKRAGEAINLFKKMKSHGVDPNDATWKSLLPAYAVEADLHQAMNMHGHLLKSGFSKKPEIVTNLIDIYSKSGNLPYAHALFDEIPTRNRDIVSWSVIIAGYGKHGHGRTAISLFNQMVSSGVAPNEITFTSVLHACGHSGLVDEGLRLFNFMWNNHRENLQTDHYTCMVDLLGRANRLEEAYETIKSMPFETGAAVWGALLGGCAIHDNVELGEAAAERLFEVEPENTGNYVLMGNIYSAVGRFDDAGRVRRRMGRVGLVKAPANSLIEVGNG